ncbi:alpha/beta fold hydrolase [Solirubrobacter sp. CPCC 204708]|uniref:Alpha/beta fold hydrolase n=1 Tax=Solirubrobacter deserti TaxID=2282478 RepID=A0ABT4RDF6_9ACTN|nr:alpha/beta fold hydrolase [Solirubrobacter deserti]MBE2314548.1 alpha/beta fold hydrolase [Solirubrobacter deserti]MDA0136552.1 alpha/beta fold hydrolase [Solirubrobacter deserti]
MRTEITVDGTRISFLSAGEGPLLLLLHGTYWSRVWEPVLDTLAGHGLRAVAVDLPGAGRSGGQLTLETGAVPALATWVERFADALEAGDELLVAGHDIGGAVTQHLAVHGGRAVPRFALVNSVTYDSWPVPGVKRFRDPEVAAAVSVEELLSWRETAITAAIARPFADGELDDYLSPWRDERRARSWLALAGAADSKYTEALMPALRESEAPKRLVWGEDDAFQPVSYAERFAAEVPACELVRIPRAGHIPMENDPHAVGDALGRFFSARSPS